MNAVLLAAGASARMGSCKQSLAFKGSSLLRHSCVTVLAALGPESKLVVVLGARADELRAELRGLPVSLVAHAGWEAGMMSSLQAGLRHLLDSAAVLVALADQPRLTGADYLRLIDTYEETSYEESGYKGTIVAAAYGGSVGAPAVFPQRHFATLLAATGAGGAKPMILAHAHTAVAMPNAAFDIDTPADYRALVGG